jgi:hypothetical protein
MPKLDGHTPERISLSFGGTIDLDRADEVFIRREDAARSFGRYVVTIPRAAARAQD